MAQIILNYLLVAVILCYTILGKRSKCLLLTIDNRDLQHSYSSQHYPTIAAVINHAYAEYHGYDFFYVQTNITGLKEQVLKKYPDAIVDPMMTEANKQAAKDIASGYHVGLKQFRSASPSKLPALWFVTQSIGYKYDYIWYIDSDAVLSPFYFNRSIDDATRSWKGPNSMLAGQRDVNRSKLIFFSNFPWRDDMPCAGSFLYRPRLQTEAIFREWWDYDLALKNFKHFHEQDWLWHMIDHSRGQSPTAFNTLFKEIYGSDRQYLINNETYSIVHERQFPSNWQRFEDHLWLVHIASYNYHLRTPILSQFLRLLRLDNQNSYSAAVDHIYLKHTMSIPALQTAEAMENLSATNSMTANASKRIRHWPPHDEKTQDIWYDSHVSSRNLPELPLSQLYKGRLVRRKGEFWLVDDKGQRRGFKDYTSFAAMELKEELAHTLKPAEVSMLAEGPVIDSQTITSKEKERLLRFYNPNSKYYPWLVAGSSPYHSHHHLHTKAGSKRHGSKSYSNSNVSTGCESSEDNSELTQLISSPGSRAILYVVTHNEESERLGQVFARCHSNWISTMPINSTKFFESNIYLNGGGLPARREAWKDQDWVITATYKTVAKSLKYNSFTQSLQTVHLLLLAAIKGSYDAAPFLRSGSKMMEFCRYFHGAAFQLAWDGILTAVGYNMTMIRAFDNQKAFYRNIFVIKPAVLDKLIVFMQHAVSVASSHPKVMQLLAVDSKYKEGSEEVALRIFGTKYYQLHPFIFERLPAFFLFSHGYRVCMAETGPCRYNS